MSAHVAAVEWNRNQSPFVDNRYSRAHEWRFDGGAVIPASSSPHVVRLPYSVAANVDPEEALVAAISSCHMLFFLGFAAEAGFVVDHYLDEAIGHMSQRADHKDWLESVILRPRVSFVGAKAPTDSDVSGLHHRSHEFCFIANSVRSEITVEGSWTHATN